MQDAFGFPSHEEEARSIKQSPNLLSLVEWGRAEAEVGVLGVARSYLQGLIKPLQIPRKRSLPADFLIQRLLCRGSSKSPIEFISRCTCQGYSLANGEIKYLKTIRPLPHARWLRGDA